MSMIKKLKYDDGEVFMYEVEYNVQVNKENQQIELVKWSGEDQVIMKIGYDFEKTGFRFKEAKAFIEKYKCLLEGEFS